MLRKENIRLIGSSILIIISLVFIGYRSAQKFSTPSEVCQAKPEADQQDIKIKSGLPIWESLSRHLITIQ
jgi:hypothetical protein